MDETAVFEGRRTSVAIWLYVIGIFMLGFGIACLCIGVYAGQESGEYVCLAPGALLGILGAACLIRARNRPNTRMVIVEPMGVRFIAEGQARWAIPWSAMRALGTKRKAERIDIYYGTVPGLITGAESGDKGIFFALDNGMIKLRLHDDFGPEKAIKQLFRHLAGQAMRRNIAVEDGLGWGQGSEGLPRRGLNDRLLSTGILAPPANLDPAGYHDKWHNGQNYSSDGPIIAIAAGLFGLGLVLSIIGFTRWNYALGAFGLFWLIFGLLVGLLVLTIMIHKVAVLAYNPNGITIRNGLGKWTTLQWAQVSRCKLDADTRQLSIYSDKGKRVGVLDENVMLALCKSFTTATGRPAETWSSGGEAYFGVPARNLN